MHSLIGIPIQIIFSNMKILIAGSMTFHNEMQQIKIDLEAMGHDVVAPYFSETETLGNTITLEEKHRLITEYFAILPTADKLLVYNESKHGVDGYIGSNTLMEMAVATHCQVPIYLWQPVGDIAAKEEVDALLPIVIHANIAQLFV